jgi:hypothetical protein
MKMLRPQIDKEKTKSRIIAGLQSLVGYLSFAHGPCLRPTQLIKICGSIASQATYRVYRYIWVRMKGFLSIAVQDCLQAWRVGEAEDTKTNHILVGTSIV